MNHRSATAWAGALGATGVALGALGAHALRTTLGASGMLDTWKTAATYQMLHAASLLALAGVLPTLKDAPARLLSWSGRLWAAGAVLFSGSLYLLALGGPRWLGPVTPLGGICLILGWVLLAVGALRAS